MDFLEKNLKIIVQILLLSIIAIVPFVRADALYFPFISGKAYLFRVLLAIAFFFWIWLLLQHKQYRPKIKQVLVVAITLFFLAQVAASFFGVDPLFSLFSSVERADGVLQYGLWIIYFFMFLSVFREAKDWKLFFSVFVLSAFALSAFSWFNHSSQGQLYGNFGNPAYFAAFLLFAIGFSFIAFERKLFKQPLLNNAFLGIAAFLIFTLIFTQVRGVYVGFAGGVFLFCVLAILFLRKEHKKLAFACGGLLLLGFAFLALLFSVKETEFVQSTRMLYRITEVTEVWEKASTRERLLNWNIALKAFREKPLFGYGPENYGAAANKYYDYRIGAGEPWFDRAHNQSLDTLATGGIAVFSLYLFWLAAAVWLILKIGREKKILSFLLGSLFLAYFLQSFFLFDLLAVYLGLFPFLAFLIFQSKQTHDVPEVQERAERQVSGGIVKHLPVLGLVALVCASFVYTTVFIPYQASASAIQFYRYSENGYYKESVPFLQESFSIESPYTFWEVRKRAGWQFVSVLDAVDEETPPEKAKEINDLYDVMTSELERFIEARPTDPQMYFVLGRMYRFGFEKLGRDDLGKAEAVLRKGINYSNLRVEYFNELTQTLLAQGKFEEAEQSVKDYAEKVVFDAWFPYVALGHFYFIARRYDQAIEQYEQARAVGYKFSEVELEYNRYIFAAQEVQEYEKIITIAKEYLEIHGSNADAYFNIAVGYLNTGQKEEAIPFFLQAVELNEEYSKHKEFFLEQ